MLKSSEQSVLHLTREDGYAEIYHAVTESGFNYQKHTGTPDSISNIGQHSLIVKDRYPYIVSKEDFYNNCVITGIPGNVFLVQGRDTLLKTICSGHPITASVFLLHSSIYEITPLEIFHLPLSREDTLRTAFDVVYSQIHNRISYYVRNMDRTLRLYHSDLSVKVRLENAEELDKLAQRVFTNLPEGYDTPVRSLCPYELS